MRNLLLLLLMWFFACSPQEEQVRGRVAQTDEEIWCAPGAVGLGVYFMNGEWNPDLSPFPNPERPTALSLTKGVDRYVEEVYLVSFLPTTEELGPDVLMTDGDFAGLDWTGLDYDSTDWRLEASGTTYQRQVFYRGAAWMTEESRFNFKFRNANGYLLDNARVRAGVDSEWRAGDDFGERRFVVRVLSLGCPAVDDCTGGQHFAEALVQLRVALDHDTFYVPGSTARLDLKWSLYEGRTWSVPVVMHNASNNLEYGLQLELDEVSPPARGYYLPGEQVQIRMTYRDGGGNRLFTPGVLPTYEEMNDRKPAAKGIRYLTFHGFPMLYWAHKPVQGAMETFLSGPVHKMTTVGTYPVTPAALFMNEVQVASRDVDGWFGTTQEHPVTPTMIPCIGDPTAPQCDEVVPDVYKFTLPADAESGTYVTGAKARREWHGEPAMTAASLRFQVGSTASTTFPAFDIPGLEDCGDCHQGPMALPNAHHGFPGVNKVSAECLGCHVDGHYFEPDAGIVTRLTYLHAQSNRLTPPD